MTYSLEERRAAVGLYIKYDFSVADVIRELGYPHRHTLRNWYLEFEEGGELSDPAPRATRYTEEQRHAAVDHYLGRGKRLARTVRALGYPSRQLLADWVDEFAPGQRRIGKPDVPAISYDDKVAAVVALETRTNPAKDVAGLATLSWTVSCGTGGARERRDEMADPKHPRHFTEEFKRQIVELHDGGKPPHEIMDEYDLGQSTLRRRINAINATGSSRAADNRTPEQERIIEPGREDGRLEMEVDALKQAAPIFARKQPR